MDFLLKNKKLLIIAVIGITIVCICSIVFISFILPKLSTGTTGNNSKTKVCDTSISTKYDGKLLTLSGSDIKGRVAIKTNIPDCRIEAQYIFLMNVNLQQNPKDNLPYLYNYIALLHAPNETDRGSSYGTGVIGEAYTNLNTFPQDKSNLNLYEFYGNPGNGGLTPTNNFFSGPTRYHELSDKGYQDMLKDTVYELINSNPYMIREDSGNGGFSYDTDINKAEKEGNIVKTFTYSYNQ